MPELVLDWTIKLALPHFNRRSIKGRNIFRSLVEETLMLSFRLAICRFDLEEHMKYKMARMAFTNWIGASHTQATGLTNKKERVVPTSISIGTCICWLDTE